MDMQLYYALYFEPVFLRWKYFPMNTLGESVRALLILFAIFVVIPVVVGYVIKKNRSTSPPAKVPSKAISEKEIEKAFSKNQRVFFGAQYIDGINHFEQGCTVVLELFPDELRMSATNTKATASLPCSRILNADVIELAKLRQDDSHKDTAQYFVIDYIDTKGEQQRITCGKPAPLAGNYPLFMAILERRVPSIAASKAAATLESPKHIDL